MAKEELCSHVAAPPVEKRCRAIFQRKRSGEGELYLAVLSETAREAGMIV